MMRADSRNRARNPPTVGPSFDDLERDVASLPALDTAALRQRWKALFGADPSPHFGRSVLVRAITCPRNPPRFRTDDLLITNAKKSGPETKC